MNAQDYAAEFRLMGDENAEKGGERYFAGTDAPNGKIRGYYFDFGYFPVSQASEAMSELKRRIEFDTSLVFDDDGIAYIRRQYIESMVQGNVARFNRAAMLLKLRDLIRDMKWMTESGDVPFTPGMEIRQYAAANNLTVAEISHSAWMRMPDGPETGTAALYGIAYWDGGSKSRAYVLSWNGLVLIAEQR